MRQRAGGGFKMSFLDNHYLFGTVCLGAGACLGYWLWRWKERSVRTALRIKEQAILESARRQAENITREAHLHASEEALKLRGQAEQALATRLSAAAEAEKRLIEREVLINHQLESMVHEEKSLRNQQLDCRKHAEELELQRTDLAAASQQRRQALQATARLSETEARQLL